MKPPKTLAGVLADSAALLVDFDGPVCSVFASLQPTDVAAQLRGLLPNRENLPQHIQHEADPLTVLRFVGELGDQALTNKVDEELRKAELVAIAGATATPHGHELLRAACRSGRKVAIVSNNSEPAIKAYLRSHDLGQYVSQVIGRQPGHPEAMKPNPKPVTRAASVLGLAPTECVLVGDSPSDIGAAKGAGVRSIGYANKPYKNTTLANAGADIVVEGVNGLEALLRLFGSASTTTGQ